MEKKIFKYPLALIGQQTVEMPTTAVLLSVQLQGLDICLWALVQPDLPKSKRVIMIYGTGEAINANDHIFIGTVQIGLYVWHVFEYTGI